MTRSSFLKPLQAIALLLGVWALISVVFPWPSPWEVLGILWTNLNDPAFQGALGASVRRMLIGYVLVMVIGLAGGVLIGRVPVLDQIMSSMGQDERTQYRDILREVRAEARKSSAPKTTPMKVWKSRSNQYSPKLQDVVDAVFRRDEMGPDEGEAPPDFNLQKLGSDERVKLSSFKGQRAVAMAFGSYT